MKNRQINDLQDAINQSKLELQNKANQHGTKPQESKANCNYQNTSLQQKTNKLSEQDEIVQQLTKPLQDLTSVLQSQKLNIDKKIRTLITCQRTVTILEDCKTRIEQAEKDLKDDSSSKHQIAQEKNKNCTRC